VVYFSSEILVYFSVEINIYDKFIEDDKLPSALAIKNRFQGKSGSRKTLLQILETQKSRVKDVGLQIVRTPISKKLRETFLCLT